MKNVMGIKVNWGSILGSRKHANMPMIITRDPDLSSLNFVYTGVQALLHITWISFVVCHQHQNY